MFYLILRFKIKFNKYRLQFFEKFVNGFRTLQKYGNNKSKTIKKFQVSLQF
jgi:hypothetical protein